MLTICLYLLLFLPVLLHLVVVLNRTRARQRRRITSGSDRAEMRERAMHPEPTK
jgi:hypothetical protein